MARPKDKSSLRLGASQPLGMSQAFANKSHQVQEKLQLKVASGLTEDFVRLLDEEVHTDFIITNGTCEVRAHYCILQARAKQFWPENLVYSTSDADGSCVKCLRMNDLSERQIKDFVRQLYSVKDSELLLEEFLPHILQGSHPETITRDVVDDTEVEINKVDIAVSKEKSVYSHASDVNSDSRSNTPCNSNPTHVHNSDENETYYDDVKDVQNGSKNEELNDNVLNGQQESLINQSRNVCLETQNNSVVSTNLHHGDMATIGHKDKKEIVLRDNSTSDQKHMKSEAFNDCVANFPKVPVHSVDDITSGVSDNILITSSSPEVALENLSLEAKQLRETATENHNDFTEIMAPSCASSAKDIDDLRENEYIEDSNQVPTKTEANGLLDNTEKVDPGYQSTTHTSINDSSNPTKVSDYINPYETCSPLGNDLLHLYLQQQSCDCCLSVEGVHFLVHKCVLSARSPYFSAMFGGQWSESNLEVVHLEGVSASAMEKVILFFYGGVTDGITSSDIFDLFIIADMYGVETMKLVLQFFLKKDMCHFFHKPCSTCIAQAPEALNLCHNFHLEELQDRLLKWVSKHFTKIWCTKTFASLGEDLHQLCVSAVVNQMTEINVLDIIMDCDKLTTSLPRIKWTESILCLTTQLMDLAIEYTSTHFIKVIHAPEFLTWAKVASWKASALEEIFNSVIDSLPVDTAISVYQTLIDLKSRETMEESCEQNLLDLLDTMIKRCEKFLRTHIFMVTRSKQWSTINKSFQSQILENSSYLHLDHFPDPKPRPKRPVLSSSLTKPKFRSVSPSSASASAQSKASKQATTRVTNQPHSRLKSSTNTKTSSSNAPEKTRSDHTVTTVKGKTHSETVSKLTKSLKSSTRPSPKAFDRSVSEGGPDLHPKPSTSSLNGHHKDNPKSKSQQLMYSSKQCSEKCKNPLKISSAKLSASLPSDKKFIGLGKSPPSRLPIKTSRERTPEKQISNSSESVSEINNAHCSSQPSALHDHRVLTSEMVDKHEQDSGISVVFMTEKNVNTSHAVKFDSVVLEGHGRQDSQKESDNSDVEYFCNDFHEDGRVDQSVVQYESKNHESPNIRIGESIENLVNHSSGSDGGMRDIQGCVQKEVNFVKTVKPLKISFVVPPDDKSKPP